MAEANQHLIWIDLEMTGLNPDTDFIIEIATIITDKDLHVLAQGRFWQYIKLKKLCEAWMIGIKNIMGNQD